MHNPFGYSFKKYNNACSNAEATLLEYIYGEYFLNYKKIVQSTNKEENKTGTKA
jgi:hypothetical protein